MKDFSGVIRVNNNPKNDIFAVTLFWKNWAVVLTQRGGPSYVPYFFLWLKHTILPKGRGCMADLTKG